MVLIVNHSDTFHCDEVVACAILQILYPDSDIVRSRDPEIIKTGDFVVDVGKIYDPVNKRYDHHQETFNMSFPRDSIKKVPMSSCGLVWLHHGKELIDCFNSEILKDTKDTKDTNIDVDIDVEYIFQQFYNNFVFPIDCNDNGVENNYNNDNITYYPIELQSIVSSFNDNPLDHHSQYLRFIRAVDMCKTIVTYKLKSLIKNNISYMKNVGSFTEAFQKSLDDKVDYMIIYSEYNITLYLNQFDQDQRIKFIIVKRSDNEWRIWTVNKKGSRFEQIAKIISEDNARILTSDIIFVHKSCFTGGCKTLSAAILVVEESLSAFNKSKSDLATSYI